MQKERNRMNIAKSYIVNEEGTPEAVVVDIKTFRKIEELLLDQALGKAMDEVAGEEELDLDDAKKFLEGISPYK